MIGVLTHHWAKADKIDEAKKLLDRNGQAQSKAPGFVSRHTLIALADPAKITTLVVWASNDIYDAWRASPQRAAAMSGADRLWAKPPESSASRWSVRSVQRCSRYPTPIGPYDHSVKVGQHTSVGRT
jgi:heme-degrading monooxygenase HmoA